MTCSKCGSKPVVAELCIECIRSTRDTIKELNTRVALLRVALTEISAEGKKGIGDYSDWNITVANNSLEETKEQPHD